MRLFLFFCILFFLRGAFAETDVFQRASVAAAQQNSQNYDGDTVRLEAVHSLKPDWLVGATADFLNREYRGGVKVRDNQFGAGVTYKAPSKYYVESSATASTDANIFARYSLLAAPHYAWDNSDAGLAVRFAEYKHLKAGTVSPSYSYFLTDRSSVGIAAHVVRTNNWISALQLQALLVPADNHLIRVTAAAGRALEDAGVEVNFKSVAVQYGYQFVPRWQVQFLYSNYSSDTRDERSFGLGLEFR